MPSCFSLRYRCVRSRPTRVGDAAHVAAFLARCGTRNRRARTRRAPRAAAGRAAGRARAAAALPSCGSARLTSSSVISRRARSCASVCTALSAGRDCRASRSCAARSAPRCENCARRHFLRFDHAAESMRLASSGTSSRCSRRLGTRSSVPESAAYSRASNAPARPARASCARRRRRPGACCSARAWQTSSSRPFCSMRFSSRDLVQEQRAFARLVQELERRFGEQPRSSRARPTACCAGAGSARTSSMPQPGSADEQHGRAQVGDALEPLLQLRDERRAAERRERQTSAAAARRRACSARPTVASSFCSAIGFSRKS